MLTLLLISALSGAIKSANLPECSTKPASSFLNEHADLTLDDFPLPPELPSGNLVSQQKLSEQLQLRSLSQQLSDHQSPYPLSQQRLQQQQRTLSQQILKSPHPLQGLIPTSPYVPPPQHQVAASPFLTGRMSAPRQQSQQRNIELAVNLQPITFLVSGKSCWANSISEGQRLSHPWIYHDTPSTYL